MIKPYFIVLGNEKGGTGKSTLAFHIIIYLLKLGFKVGSIDVDARQGSLTRYIKNRKIHCEKNNIELETPEHISINKSVNGDTSKAFEEEENDFHKALRSLSNCNFVVIDTPGNDTNLSRMAHSFADTIITPINDSLIDLDVLVHLDQNNDGRARPSIYAEMIWEQKKKRIIKEKKEIEWIVLRNRLSNILSKNKQHMEVLLTELEKRIGFKKGEGFSERVIFRELFLSGTTLLDMSDKDLNLSHISARQELRNLIATLNIDITKKENVS